MRPLGRKTLFTEQVSDDRRLDQLERRFNPDPLCCPMPTAIAEGSAFTAEDGAYYSLAQLLDADPGAFGVMDVITVYNDPADGTRNFLVKVDDGAGGVIQVFSDTATGELLMGYDGVVVFDDAIDTDVVTVTLYLGKTVAGTSNMSYEVELLEKVAASNGSAVAFPTVRVTGQIGIAPGAFPGAGTNLPSISPILLVEGADTDVKETHFHLSVLSELLNPVVFTPVA